MYVNKHHIRVSNLTMLAQDASVPFYVKLLQLVDISSPEAVLVAENPGVGEELLTQLSESKNKEVRQNVAGNPNVTVELLKKLTTDKLGSVRSSAHVKLMQINTPEANKILTNLDLSKITKFEAEAILVNLTQLNTQNNDELTYLFKQIYRVDTNKPFVYELVEKWTEKFFKEGNYDIIVDFLNARNNINLKNEAVVQGLLNWQWVQTLIAATDETWEQLTNILKAIPKLEGRKNTRGLFWLPIYSAQVPEHYLAELNRLTGGNLTKVKIKNNYKVDLKIFRGSPFPYKITVDQAVKAEYEKNAQFNTWLANNTAETVAEVICKEMNQDENRYVSWTQVLWCVLNNKDPLTVFKLLINEMEQNPTQAWQLKEALVNIDSATLNTLAIIPLYSLYPPETKKGTIFTVYDWQRTFGKYVAKQLENEPVETLRTFQQLSPTFTGTMAEFLEVTTHV